MAKQAEHNYAWGLEIGGSRLRLVRLSRADEGFAVDAVHVAELGDSQGRTLNEALAALPLPSPDEPLAVCIADEAVLYRRFDLPPADADATDQMVRAQVEALLPLPIEQITWGWARTGSEDAAGGVLLCAARSSAAKPLGDANVPHTAAVTLPSVLAAGAALQRCCAEDDQRLVLLDVASHTTTMLVLGDHGPEHAATMAIGGNDLQDQGDETALADWRDELSQTYRHVIQALPDAPPPTRCVLIGRGSRVDDLVGAAEAALRLPADYAAAGSALTVPADVAMDEVLPAAGAALHVLSPPTRPLVLADGQAAVYVEPSGRVSIRMVAAAAMIVTAVIALYGLDVRRADRLEAATESAQTDSDHRKDMAQALALGQYLQAQPPPPLLVLQALSTSASQRVQITQWQYDARGQVTMSGTVRGVADLDETLTHLAEAPAFDQVELRSANVQRNTWTFELEASLVPLHRHLALSAAAAAQPSPDEPVVQERPTRERSRRGFRRDE